MELYAIRQTGTSITFYQYYRIKGQSRTKKMFKLGKYPALKASEATEKAIQVLKWAEQGIDPKRVQEAAIRKEEKVNEASRITFGEFLEDFLSRPVKGGRQRTDKTVRDYRTSMKNHAADLMQMPIRLITADDVQRVFLRVPTNEMRKSVLRQLRAIFNNAKRRVAGDGQPFVLPNVDPLMLVAEHSDQSRTREVWLSLTEFQQGQQYMLDCAYAANDFNFWSQANAVQITALLGLRHGESVMIRSRDVYRTGDLWQGDIVDVPFVRISILKKRRAYYHYLPLTPVLDSVITAQQLVKWAWQRARSRDTRNLKISSPWLFPAPRDPDKHLNDCGMAVAYFRRGIEYRNNGYQCVIQNQDASVDEGGFSMHWLRHTFIRMCENLGVPAEDIDRAQAKFVGFASSNYGGGNPTTPSTTSVADRIDRLRYVWDSIAMLFIGFDSARQLRTAKSDTDEYENLLSRIATNNKYLQMSLNPQGRKNADWNEIVALADYEGGRFNNIDADIEGENYSDLVRAANFMVHRNYEWPRDIQLYQDGDKIHRSKSAKNGYPLHVHNGEVSDYPAR